MRLKNLFSRTLRHFLVRLRQYGFDKEAPHCTKKTSPSGAKQFFKSKFLLRQGKKASNADALRNFGAQYRRKFALKNRIELGPPQLKLISYYYAKKRRNNQVLQS